MSADKKMMGIILSDNLKKSYDILRVITVFGSHRLAFSLYRHPASVRPLVRPSTFSNDFSSEAVWPIL